jgi:hypothetical protein
LGEHHEARALDEELVGRSATVLGAEHPSTLAVALNLSLDLRQCGETEQAIALHAQTRAALHRVLGENHPAAVMAGQFVRAICDTDTMQL